MSVWKRPTQNDKKNFFLSFFICLSVVLQSLILSISEHAPDARPLSSTIAPSERARRRASSMVSMRMRMSMIVRTRMSPRITILFPALPIIFHIHTRVPLMILAGSQRRQLQSRPDVPDARAARGRRSNDSRRRCRGSCRSDGTVFPRRRRNTAMTRSSRSALPPTILALPLLLLCWIHARRGRCRRVAWRASPVLVLWRRRRWRVLIGWVVSGW